LPVRLPPVWVLATGLRSCASYRSNAARYEAPHVTSSPASGSENQGLEFGLDQILDGIELLVTARRGVREH
jgi:hypothetical protein